MEIVFALCAVYFAAYSTVLFFMTVTIWVGLSAMLVATVLSVLYTTGAAEYAINAFRHAALFMQAFFIVVFISIGSDRKSKFFAVVLCTVGCFIISVATEMWLNVKKDEG